VRAGGGGEAEGPSCSPNLPSPVLKRFYRPFTALLSVSASGNQGKGQAPPAPATRAGQKWTEFQRGGGRFAVGVMMACRFDHSSGSISRISWGHNQV